MKRFLSKIGLSEKEALLYKECLRSEQNTPTTLARQTGIKRNTAYLYLKRLQQKGLLGYRIKNKKKYIVAIKPKESLRKYLEDKKENLAVAEKLFEKTLSSLQKKESAEETEVFHFTTREGARMAIDIIIKEKLNIYFIGRAKTIFNVISKKEFYQKMTLERLKMTTKLFGITSEDIYDDSIHKDRLGDFRNYRIYPQELSAKTAKAIFGDYLCLFAQGDSQQNVILIKNRQLARYERELFKTLWYSLPEDNKKA